MTANDAVAEGGVKDGVAPVNNGVGDTIGQQKQRKLHGRAFYESIGSPKFVLAPMVDQSEFVCSVPFKHCRNHNTDSIYQD